MVYHFWAWSVSLLSMDCYFWAWSVSLLGMVCFYAANYARRLCPAAPSDDDSVGMVCDLKSDRAQIRIIHQVIVSR